MKTAAESFSGVPISRPFISSEAKVERTCETLSLETSWEKNKEEKKIAIRKGIFDINLFLIKIKIYSKVHKKKQLQKGTVSLKKNRCGFSGDGLQILRAAHLS